MSLKVGFIGAGIIGKPMAMNVMRDFPLMVYDINPKTLDEFAKAGATIATSATSVRR